MKTNNNNSIYVSCYVPSTILSTLYALIHLAFTKSLRGIHYYYPWFKNEDTDAQVVSDESEIDT